MPNALGNTAAISSTPHGASPGLVMVRPGVGCDISETSPPLT